MMCKIYVTVLNCFAALLCSVCFGPGHAAERDPLAADRPGLSSSTAVIGTDHVQIEVGYERAEATSGDDPVTQTFPFINIRKGITNELEINFMWRGWSRFSVNDQSSTAENDIAVGAKYAMYAATAHHVSLLGAVNAPVGDASVTSDHYDPTVGVIWDYTLTPSIGLFGTILGSTIKPNVSRIYTLQPAIGASVSLTSGLAAFVEYYSTIPSKEETTHHTLDAGFTYLISDDIQVDGSGGIGLNHEASDFIGFGLAYRLNF